MINTDVLDDIIYKEDIIKEICVLPESLYGFYKQSSQYTLILINEDILCDSSVYRCVLAEEVGHHFTSIGSNKPKKFMHYRDRITLDKQETMALKWATDFLIPTDKLLQAFQNKLITLPDLVEQFAVTEEFLMLKFKFMSWKNHVWIINDRHYLHLYNLTNIHIYVKM